MPKSDTDKETKPKPRKRAARKTTTKKTATSSTTKRATTRKAPTSVTSARSRGKQVSKALLALAAVGLVVLGGSVIFGMSDEGVINVSQTITNQNVAVEEGQTVTDIKGRVVDETTAQNKIRDNRPNGGLRPQTKTPKPAPTPTPVTTASTSAATSTKATATSSEQQATSTTDVLGEETEETAANTTASSTETTS